MAGKNRKDGNQKGWIDPTITSNPRRTGESELLYNLRLKKLLVPQGIAQGQAICFLNPRWKRIEAPAGLIQKAIYEKHECVALVFSQKVNPPQRIEVNEYGVHGTLLFNDFGGLFRCFAPWYSIQGLVVRLPSGKEHAYGFPVLPLEQEEQLDRRIITIH